ncbi:hypothetical protein [Solibacillus sp. FSL H8-0538]
MKIIVQAVICSIIVHVIYFVSIFLWSYMKTKAYTSDFPST